MKRSRSLAYAAACVLFSSYLLLPAKFNLDWESYRFLYLSQGGWLRDSGRDALFIYIGALSQSIGLSYEAFRTSIAILMSVFFFYTVVQCSNYVTSSRLKILVIALLLVFAPRTVIQMREGLALTALFSAIYFDFFRSASSSLLRSTAALLFYSCAMAIHIGMAPIILIRLLSLPLNSLRWKQPIIWWSVAPIALLSMLVMYLLYIDSFVEYALVRAELSARASNVGSLSFASLLFWSVQALLAILASSLIRDAAPKNLPRSSRFVTFAWYNVQLVVMPCIFAVLALQYLEISPVVTVSFVRLYGLSSALSVLSVVIMSQKVFGVRLLLVGYAASLGAQYFRTFSELG